MITLFEYWRSSAAYRVRIGLHLLGLTYRSVPVDLVTGAQRAPENLARNPQGLVPTLEIDGLRMTQSLAILEYLNDTRGGLLPPDAAGRARVRALAYALAMEVAPVTNLSVRTHVASLGGISAEDWQRHYITEGLAAFEVLLDHDDTGRCCHGNLPTLADLCLLPQVYNATRVGIDVTSFPWITKIVAHLVTIPAFAAARTAIGSFGGALAGMPPIDIATYAAKAALGRAGVEGAQIGHVVMGHVINTEPRDMYLSRVMAMQAGIPDTTPAMNVNRLCGSGLQAIVSAMQALLLGDAEMALAGGAECMSRSPYILPAARFGQKMGDVRAIDMMTGALTCPFGTGHMGVTAENVAVAHGISRAEQDAFALESQTRAARAIAEGRFASQIVGVEVGGRKGPATFAQDEHPKVTSAEALAGLRPAFQKDGTVTAGNASGINDGAAALVLSRDANGARARIMAYAHAGVDPKVMGIGPIPAVQALCAKLGMRPQDFDLVESNEAFAAQAIAVSRALGLDPARVNPNGGAIALGHPVGATGAMLVVKALHELERIGGKTALITMCIGGGQGIALALELP